MYVVIERTRDKITGCWVEPNLAVALAHVEQHVTAAGHDGHDAADCLLHEDYWEAKEDSDYRYNIIVVASAQAEAAVAWKCPSCGIVQAVCQRDLAEVGIPMCADCDRLLEIQDASV